MNGMDSINVIAVQFYYIYAKKMKSPRFHCVSYLYIHSARLRLTYLFYSIRPDTTRYDTVPYVCPIRLDFRPYEQSSSWLPHHLRQQQAQGRRPSPQQEQEQQEQEQEQEQAHRPRRLQ
jgi:hypothetical protein